MPPLRCPNKAFPPIHPIDDVGVIITQIVAMGSPLLSHSSRPSTSSFGLESATISTPPTHQNVFSSRKSSSSNVKIVQAVCKRLSNGKMEFSGRNQLFIDVNERTANLDYITLAVGP